jgi:hypothetical protein
MVIIEMDITFCSHLFWVTAAAHDMFLAVMAGLDAGGHNHDRDMIV